ncbi:hypothetical protein D9M68_390460 [compost metagenome]
MVPLPPLATRSRPWSKNWPKKVMKALNGADRPSSGAVFGMTSRAPTGIATPSRSYSTPSTSVPRPASTNALTAAGLLLVMSTIRLLMMRGSASTTLPLGP